MNEDGAMDVMEAAESSNLSSEAVAAQKASLKEMWMVCCDYTKNFRSRQENPSFQGGEDPGGSNDLLLCDAFYNVRCLQVLANSDHDVLILNNIIALFKHAEKIFKCGEHRHIFCSAAQFAFW